MRYLLDTSVFSQPIKDHPIKAAQGRWRDAGDSSVCTSAICLAELLAGLEDRRSPKYWRRYREFLENRFRILPLDDAVAATYGELYAAARREGRPRPVVDLLIAATAKRHNLILATLNLKDFRDLPGLAVEDWSH